MPVPFCVNHRHTNGPGGDLKRDSPVRPLTSAERSKELAFTFLNFFHYSEPSTPTNTFISHEEVSVAGP